MMKNIAILCSGGDVSGMNAALKRFVEYSIAKGLAPYFVECSYEGLIDNDITQASYYDVAGIPSTIDTALNVIKIAIDSIRDTASSFKRAFVIEAMGRECGYLALVSALTSGAEMCLIPEIPYELDNHKKIEDVAFKKYQINQGLLKLAKEYGRKV